MRQRYEDIHSVDVLTLQFQKLQSKTDFQDRVPVILNVQIDPLEPSVHENRHLKYMMRTDQSLAELYEVTRRKLGIHESEAIFISWKGHMECVSRTIGEIYQAYKHESGMLIGDVHREQTFGSC